MQDVSARRALGNRIRLFRSMKRMTSTNLARSLGVSRQQIWLLESGQARFPEPQVIKRLAALLGVREADLISAEVRLSDPSLLDRN